MEVGQIVQITNEKHPWFPCLLIVSEVKAWGVQAYTLAPMSNDGSEPPSQYFNRLKYEDIEAVGSARYFLMDGDN